MSQDAALAAPASATIRRATLVGSGAIGLWSTLALVTTLTGAVPPFLMVGLTFSVAALLMAAKWISSGEPVLKKLVWPPQVWALGVYGLFGYHALYFLALKTAPAVEANLVNYLWPLLIVLFSALLPGERLRWFHVAGAALGLAGAAILTLGGGKLALSWDFALGYGAALGCALVWSSYSVLSPASARCRPTASAVSARPPPCSASPLISCSSRRCGRKAGSGRRSWHSAWAPWGSPSISGITA